MITADNSTLFTEGNFQPNDLITQMAELEVQIDMLKEERKVLKTPFLGWFTCFVGKGQGRFSNDQGNMKY